MQRKGLISKTKTEIKDHVLSKSQSSSFHIVKKLLFFFLPKYSAVRFWSCVGGM